MIAAISMMRRQDQITLGRFRRHWLDVHGPMVCTFDGLKAYVQCHPVDSPAMNARARDMRIDGFPILYFENDDDRRKTQLSPAMAACNEDSKLFVGAVTRVASEVETIRPAGSAIGRFSVLDLYTLDVDLTLVAADAERMAELPALEALARYHVRRQGAAPASAIRHLQVSVGAALHARFPSLVDLEYALEGWDQPNAARFVVEEHWMV